MQYKDGDVAKQVVWEMDKTTEIMCSFCSTW